MTDKDIARYIKQFNEKNGSNTYSQRDLLKYLITRIDDIDVKLEMHVDRISSVETTIGNFKWMFGMLLVAVFGIFGMVFVMMVN